MDKKSPNKFSTISERWEDLGILKKTTLLKAQTLDIAVC